MKEYICLSIHRKMKTPFFLYFFLGSLTLLQAQTKSTDSLKVALSHAKNDIEKAQTLNAIADEYKTIDPKAMQHYAAKALAVSQKIQFNIEEGKAQLNLGNAAIILGNYLQALQHFAAAQSIFENEIQANSKNNLEVKKGLAKAYGSIGIVFSEQSNYSKGLQYHLKSVKIYREHFDAFR